MDEWLRKRLIDSGILRADGVTRRLRFSQCSGCGAWIMRALDGDICAVAVTLDMGQAGRTAEFIAIMQGRRTFEMVMLNRPGVGFSYTIEPRRPYHIARATRHPVLIEHRCGSVLPLDVLPLARRYPDDPPY